VSTFRQEPSQRWDLFDCPGKAALWGAIGCALCAGFACLGLRWALGFTLGTALAGCFNGCGFDAPGKATAWATAGCIAGVAYPDIGWKWITGINLATALAGCWKG
jgi:hypothetical protein